MISRFFIDRPIFATVISVVFVLAGGVAVFRLPVAQYPEVTPPTVEVTALYPGANATTVRDVVAAPIEEQVSGVEGMMYMSSTSTNDGAYTLTVTFKLGMDSDMAQVLVQNRVSLALPVIPALVQNEGISVKKMSPNTLMIVNLISRDRRYDSLFLSNYATIYVRDELGRVEGVAEVNYLGQRDYSMRVWLKPQKMAALGLSAMDVVTAISQQNIQVAAGQIGQEPAPKGQQFQLTINTLGRLVGKEQFESIILKAAQGPLQAQPQAGAAGSSSASSGATTDSSLDTLAASSINGPAPQAVGVVRLRDVARVELGSQQYDQACTMDGQPSVALTVYQLPGSNALQTAQGVYKKMKELKTRFPEGLDYEIVYDTTPFIKESVNEVFHTLRDAVILVAIVVLVFLQDWRAMILPMIDVPVSLIGTFAVMAMLGYSLNNLTLFGLVLAIGIVVDDAIVVLENIERLIATGLDARTATIKAMEEITGPVCAITLVLSSVFIPCCFLGGISGQFFRQFAVTIAVSTIISAVNALTMTPSRAVMIFKTEEAHGGHEHKKEALPWWIFSILGGFAAVWLADKYVAGRWGMPSMNENDYAANAPGWMSWAVWATYFAPGAFVGGVIGWFIIGPVNYVLGIVFRAFNRFFDWGTGLYGWTVGKALRLSVVMVVAYVGLLGLTYWQFTSTPTGFIPQQDKGYLLVNVQLPDSASVARTQEAMTRIQRITLGDWSDKYKGPLSPANEDRPWFRLTENSLAALRTEGLPEPVLAKLQALTRIDPVLQEQFLDKLVRTLGHDDGQNWQKTILSQTEKAHYPGIPGVEHTVGISGRSLILNANAPNLGSVYVMLKKFEDRTGEGLTADAIAAELQERCRTAVSEAVVQTFGAPPVDGLGTTGGYKIIIEDRGSLGVGELQRVSDQIAKRGNKTEGLAGLYNSSGAHTPFLYLDIDRTKCMALGVAVSDVFNTLQVYLGSYYVNNYNQFGRTWQVNVQADPMFRYKVTDILRLQVRNNQKQMIRLATVMNVRDTSGPAMVMRYNLYSASAITGNTTGGTSSGQAVEMVERIANEEMPRSMAYDWTELALLQNQAGNTAMVVFVLAVVFVFLVLAAQYESWKLPLAVILVVPMCLLCSVIGVQIARMDISIFTQIGFVVLVGLACKNAILIVEFAKQEQESGVPRYEATVEACKLRLRPILMTSFAFILGVVPLVIAEGAGAEMRRSLGTAVFAGMLGVTAFGIFLTPVFYYVIQSFGDGHRRTELDVGGTKVGAEQGAPAPAAGDALRQGITDRKPTGAPHAPAGPAEAKKGPEGGA